MTKIELNIVVFTIIMFVHTFIGVVAAFYLTNAEVLLLAGGYFIGLSTGLWACNKNIIIV